MLFTNRFEDIASSNGQYENEDDDEGEQPADGAPRPSKKKKAPREHVRHNAEQLGAVANGSSTSRFPTTKCPK